MQIYFDIRNKEEKKFCFSTIDEGQFESYICVGKANEKKNVVNIKKKREEKKKRERQKEKVSTTRFIAVCFCCCPSF